MADLTLVGFPLSMDWITTKRLGKTFRITVDFPGEDAYVDMTLKNAEKLRDYLNRSIPEEKETNEEYRRPRTLDRGGMPHSARETEQGATEGRLAKKLDT